MDNVIVKKKFKDIPLADPFFDSLKASYREFEKWYESKSDNSAYVTYDEDKNIIGFLYLKVEHGAIKDIKPVLNTAKCLKVGTFKINPHNTKLGERYIKKMFDTTLTEGIRDIYVTVFPKHEDLITLFAKYGFIEHGVKESPNGTELVYHKDFSRLSGDYYQDYPVVDLSHNKTWLLAIYPEFHTKLFPDSVLKTEDPKNVVEDVSHTNSIQKIYIAWMNGLDQLKSGDGIIIYRTSDIEGQAEYRAVATSICTVVKAVNVSHFKDEADFVKKLLPYSVFTDAELRKHYRKKRADLVVIKMLYNLALPKRPTRHALVEDCGIERDQYWGFFEINSNQLSKVLELGEVYEGIIIN